MKLIVGLCNPEEKYKISRHNSGAMVLDRFLSIMDVDISIDKYSGKLYGPINVSNETVYALKPTTTMNYSGIAVKEAMEGLSIDISDILVISDDVDLSLGTIRLRNTGSSGRHKGLDSVLTELGAKNVSRLRIGIGPKPKDVNMLDFVLGNFSNNELLRLNDAISTAVGGILTWVHDGIEKTMTRYNSKGMLC